MLHSFNNIWIHAFGATKKKALILLSVSVLLASCATLNNEPYMNIFVHTTEPSRLVLEEDTIETKNNKARLEVERKNEALQIMAITDSLSKSIEVAPINSFNYWINIVTNFGIGMLVDRGNPRRFGFPRRIYLNSADTISRFFRHPQSDNQGEIHLHLSLPHINAFSFTPEHEATKISVGFWGLTVGLDYYHSRNQFINLGVTEIVGLFIPIPAPITLEGEYEQFSTRFISLSNNHRIRRLTLGYGLSFARNTWNFRYFEGFEGPPPTREPIKRSHTAYRLIFSTYFLSGEHFHLGLVYRPTFFRPENTHKFQYEHLISIDFAWKIRLKR